MNRSAEISIQINSYIRISSRARRVNKLHDVLVLAGGIIELRDGCPASGFYCAADKIRIVAPSVFANILGEMNIFPTGLQNPEARAIRRSRARERDSIHRNSAGGLG